MRQKHIDPLVFLPLTPAVFQILLALADRERHGYGIMQEIENRTEGKVQLGPGTLYGSIKRMIKDRLIVESAERPDPELDDERRRYYRLTDFGRKVYGGGGIMPDSVVKPQVFTDAQITLLTAQCYRILCRVCIFVGALRHRLALSALRDCLTLERYRELIYRRASH